MAVLMPDENKPQGTQLVQSLRGKEKRNCVKGNCELKILGNVLDSREIQMIKDC